MANDSYVILTDGTKIEFSQENTPITNFGEIQGLINGNSITRTDIKEISFGKSYENITTIDQRFLISSSNLEKVDLKGLSNVNYLGSRFLEGCAKLKQVNLSHFTNLTNVDNNLMLNCASLNEICIGYMSWENVYFAGAYRFQGVPNTSDCKIYAPSLELGNAFKSKFSSLSDWTVEVKDCNVEDEVIEDKNIYNNIYDGDIHLSPKKIVNFKLTMDNPSLFVQSEYINNNVAGEKFIIKTDQLDSLAIDYLRSDYSNVRFYHAGTKTLLKHKFVKIDDIKAFIVEIPHQIIQNSSSKIIDLNIILLYKSDSYTYNGETSIFKYYYKDPPMYQYNQNHYQTGNFDFQEIIFTLNTTRYRHSISYYANYEKAASNDLSSSDYLNMGVDIGSTINITQQKSNNTSINHGSLPVVEGLLFMILRAENDQKYVYYQDFFNNSKFFGEEQIRGGDYIAIYPWDNHTFYVTNLISMQNPYSSKDGQITLSNFAFNEDYIPSKQPIMQGLIAWYKGMKDVSFWNDYSGNNNSITNPSNITRIDDETISLEKNSIVNTLFAQSVFKNGGTYEFYISQESIPSGGYLLNNSHMNGVLLMYAAVDGGTLYFGNIINMKEVLYTPDINKYVTITLKYESGGTGYSLYINGIKIGSGIDNTNQDISNIIAIGSTTGGGTLPCNIKDIKFYNRALTDDEILYNHNANVVNYNKFSPLPDYSELEDYYWNTAHEITNIGYTDLSWSNFVLRRTRAYDMILNKTAKYQEEILDMIEFLKNAIDNLITDDSYVILTNGTKIKFNSTTDNPYFDILSNTIISKGDTTDIKEVFFGESFKNITAIGDHFLSHAYFLRQINLEGLSQVTNVGQWFLSNCELTRIDFSHFTNLTRVDYGFMTDCRNLNKVCIGDINWKEIMINGGFFDYSNNSNCKIYASSLELGNEFKNKFSNLSNWTVEIGGDCEPPISDSYIILTDDTKIEFNQDDFSVERLGDFAFIINNKYISIDEIKEVSIGESYEYSKEWIYQYFLYRAINLEKVNLKGLSGISEIHDSFLRKCSKLEEINLSYFNNLKWTNDGFMDDCTSLNKVCIGDINWKEISTGDGFSNVPNNSDCTIYASSIKLGNEFKNKFPNLSNWTVKIGDCKPKEPLDYTQLQNLLNLINSINPDLYIGGWDKLISIVNNAQKMITNDTAETNQDILDMIDKLNEAINNLEEKYIPPPERPVTETDIEEDQGDTDPLTSNPITAINYRWTKVGDEYVYIFNGSVESYNIKLFFNDIDIDVDKVRGIELQFDRLKENGADKRDSIIRIDKGNQYGENKAKPEIYQNGVWQTVKYGAKNDLWELDLNNTKDLSLRFNCKGSNEENNTIIKLRNIVLRIYYEDVSANIYNDYPMFSKYKQINANKFYHQIKNKDGEKIWLKEPYRESYMNMKITMDKELPEKINMHTAQTYTDSSTKTQKQHWIGMTSTLPSSEMILGITDGLDQFNVNSNKFDDKDERLVKNNNRIDNSKGLIGPHELKQIQDMLLKYQKYDLITITKAGTIKRNKDD